MGVLRSHAFTCLLDRESPRHGLRFLVPVLPPSPAPLCASPFLPPSLPFLPRRRRAAASVLLSLALGWHSMERAAFWQLWVCTHCCALSVRRCRGHLCIDWQGLARPGKSPLACQFSADDGFFCERMPALFRPAESPPTRVFSADVAGAWCFAGKKGMQAARASGIRRSRSQVVSAPSFATRLTWASHNRM